MNQFSTVKIRIDFWKPSWILSFFIEVFKIAIQYLKKN